MKAREIFGLVVRIAGFLIATWGILDVAGGVSVLKASLQNTVPSGELQYPSSSYFIMGAFKLVFALFCLFRTEKIVRWTYRD